MSRNVPQENIFQHRYLVHNRLPNLDAEILTPDLTILTSKDVFFLNPRAPTIMMLKEYDCEQPFRPLSSIYRASSSILSLLPVRVEVVALFNGTEDLPRGLKFEPVVGWYDGVKGQPIALVIKNMDQPISDSVHLEMCSSYLATRIVELGRLINQIEINGATSLPSFANSRLFASMPQVTHEMIDHLLSLLYRHHPAGVLQDWGNN